MAYLLPKDLVVEVHRLINWVKLMSKMEDRLLIHFHLTKLIMKEVLLSYFLPVIVK